MPNFRGKTRCFNVNSLKLKFTLHLPMYTNDHDADDEKLLICSLLIYTLLERQNGTLVFPT